MSPLMYLPFGVGLRTPPNHQAAGSRDPHHAGDLRSPPRRGQETRADQSSHAVRGDETSVAPGRKYNR